MELLLDPVVTHRCGGIQPVGDVRVGQLFDVPGSDGSVGPDPGEAVGLQLETHRPAVDDPHHAAVLPRVGIGTRTAFLRQVDLGAGRPERPAAAAAQRIEAEPHGDDQADDSGAAAKR